MILGGSVPLDLNAEIDSLLEKQFLLFVNIFQ